MKQLTCAIPLAAAVAAACMLAGCTDNVRSQATPSPQRDALVGGHDARTGALLADLYDGGERDAVLNLDRLGRNALMTGDLDTAARAFDAAIARIEAVYADTPSARKARSTFGSEARKDFKGEPYERAMTFFYRGLVDLAQGDFENARAAFKSSEFQTTMSYGEDYGGVFPTAMWMAGWASQCAGDEAAADEYFASAASEYAREPWLDDGVRASLGSAQARPSRDSRTLLVYESGIGPGKSTEGKYQESLKFVAGSEPTSLDARLGVRGAEATWTSGDDPGWQSRDALWGLAAFRDGRQVDSILAGKANFKSTAHDVGDASMEIGMQAMQQAQFTNNSDLAGVGAAAALIGIFASMASEAAKPAADTRTWPGLPGSLYVRAQTLAPTAELELRSRADGGAWTQAAHVLDRGAGGCRLVLASDGAADGSDATHDTITDGERKRAARGNRQRDAAFRQFLVDTFAHAAPSPAIAAAPAAGP